MRRRNVIIFVIFLLVAAGVVGSQYLFRWSEGTFLNPPPPLAISVIYSGELRAWLEPATQQFNSEKHKTGNQAVEVTIEQVDDGEALRDIVAGRRAPTAWIPASTIWVNLLNSQWRASHQSDLLLRSGEYGATPMCLTPMVFVMYADRAEAFTREYPTVDWNEVQGAVTAPGGWKDLGGPEEWGRVKYSQTSPANSNAGLLAVALATYSYFNKTGALASADLDNAGYQDWIDGLASGLVADAPPTAQQQIEDLLRYGASRYDIVSIYESLVAQQIKNARGRFGDDLKVFYPRLNIWSDYPFSILVGEQSTAEQKDAALLFERYLYSPPVQSLALKAGFRPANPDVPLLTSDPDNPFNVYKDAGLQIKIPRTVIVDAPSGEVLDRLRDVFQR
ncbi:MAG TPA: substrate-binding domain-containing protein [Chloroflexia bacterium]|jgi:ABC-type Fe3+ transport system substrate-binding protein